MTTPEPPSSPDPSDQPIPPSVTPTVAPTQSCARCGYEIGGLDTDARCPECGAPIAASLRGDLLRYADPREVRFLARGATWLCISAGSALATLLLAFLHAQPFPSAGAAQVAWAALGATAVLALVSWCVGWWCLSAGPIDSSRGANGVTLTLSIATAVLAIIVLAGVPFLLYRGAARAPVLPPIATTGVSGFLMPFTFLLCPAGPAAVQYVSGLLLIRRIAARVPDAPLAASATRLIWGPGLALLCLLLGAPPQPVGVMLAMAGSLGMLVCAIGYVGLLFALRERLRTELDAAIRNASAPLPHEPGAQATGVPL